MRLTEHELNGAASFISGYLFVSRRCPIGWTIARFRRLYDYRAVGEAHFFRLNHALGNAIVARASQRELPVADVVFDYTHTRDAIVLSTLRRQSGLDDCCALVH